MEKPQPETIEFYDWNACEEWIKTKYKKDIRDWRGKFDKGKEDEEYCDFWHSIMDNREIHNGCFFDIEDWDLGEDSMFKKDWEKEIISILLTEFCEDKIKAEKYGRTRSVKFFVWW